MNGAAAHASRYGGEELDLFWHARRWKTYWSTLLRPWIAGDVLEVGAGIGANTTELQNPSVRSWQCLEPDAELAERARHVTSDIEHCTVTVGTTGSIRGCSFDTVMYIDVLEHIERDREELDRVTLMLRPGGRLVVLAPAHQWLYSPFDAAIGHFRRYNRRMLRACTPPGCRLDRLMYLDSVGMMLSLGNRALLRRALPTLRQVRFWDRCVVPMSTICDPLFNYRIGKSIIAVWTRV